VILLNHIKLRNNSHRFKPNRKRPTQLKRREIAVANEGQNKSRFEIKGKSYQDIYTGNEEMNHFLRCNSNY